MPLLYIFFKMEFKVDQDVFGQKMTFLTVFEEKHTKIFLEKVQKKQKSMLITVLMQVD